MHLLLFLVTRATMLQPFQDQHPAGGTEGVPASDVRVRDAAVERGLEDAGRRVSFNDAAIAEIVDDWHYGSRD